MAVTVRDEWLPRSIMVLCLGTGLLLLLTHWRSRTTLARTNQPPSPRSIQAARLPMRQGAATAAIRDSNLPTAPTAERAAVLPVSRAQVSSTASDRKLVVDLSDRQVHVYDQQKVLVSYPIAIGKDGWETPQGTFRIEQKRINPEWTHPISRETIPPGPDNPWAVAGLVSGPIQPAKLGFTAPIRKN